MREIRRVLIVEDDAKLRGSLERLLGSWDLEVEACATVAAVTRLLPRGFDCVLTDVCLPDGTASDVVRAAAGCRPMPHIVAMSGAADRDEIFRLGHLGVHAYLDKPLNFERLRRSLFNPPAQESVRLHGMLADLVGQADIRSVEEAVRHTMFEQALALAGGNLTEAARMLRVTRQAVQRQLRR